MNASRTARERARTELTREIKEEARRQLAAEGAQRLSLRAVARELGMVSSALYRYFPSRDDLLTALIIDAYAALGAVGEQAVAASKGGPRKRWLALCHAVRDWARAHPHEYALIYGSPVPGYAAPRTTIEPAARVVVALLAVVEQAQLPEPATAERMSPDLAEQARQLAQTLDVDIPGPVLVRVITAWTQLYGMISFELFGHLVGSMDPTEGFFQYAVEQMADFIGLPE